MIGARPAPQRGDGNGGGPAEPDDHALEAFVDVHAFTPDELTAFASRAALRRRGACAARSCSPTGSAGRTARWRRAPWCEDVPWLWRQYAYRGYLLLQQVDSRLLEPRFPARVFYNLMVTGTKPE